MRTVSIGLAACFVLAASTGFASAQSAPALVVSDLHHRSGPSSNAPSYGVISGGTTIPAGPCGGGWCQAFLNGNPGFVSQQYLDFGGPPPPPPAVGPGVIYAPPPPSYPVYPPYHRSWDSRRW